MAIVAPGILNGPFWKQRLRGQQVFKGTLSETVSDKETRFIKSRSQLEGSLGCMDVCGYGCKCVCLGVCVRWLSALMNGFLDIFVISFLFISHTIIMFILCKIFSFVIKKIIHLIDYVMLTRMILR